VTGLERNWQDAEWVVVDVEGNGQQPPDLLEAACVPIDGGQPGILQTWLVRPHRPITGLAARIHGIRNPDVADAPTVAAVAAEIQAALAGRIVIGHQVHVDLAVLTRELRGCAAPLRLDTLRLAKAVWPGLPSYRLDALTQHAGIQPLHQATGRRHRAGFDAALTAALFLALAQAAGDRLTAAALISLAHPVTSSSRTGGNDAQLF
jgi:DNA polymerase III epsilon subunit-like protein